MDSVDWAMNAAQINRDIRLANEHLPPGMQVHQPRHSVAWSFCSNRSMLHQYHPPDNLPESVSHFAPCIVAMQRGRCIASAAYVAHIRQVSAIELPACERPFAFSPEHDPCSPASDSVPANGPFAAMSGSR